MASEVTHRVAKSGECWCSAEPPWWPDAGTEDPEAVTCQECLDEMAEDVEQSLVWRDCAHTHVRDGEKCPGCGTIVHWD